MIAKIRTIPSSYPKTKKPKPPEFPIANEDFTPLRQELNKIRNINFYLGVCGGGTQNIYLLSFLTKHNKLRLVELFDILKPPLENFTHIAKAYNESVNNFDYFLRIIKQYRRFKVRDVPYHRFFFHMFHRKSTGFEETNFKKWTLSKNLTIKLIHQDILKHIKTINTEGVYFIYLSNILTFLGMSRGLKFRYRFYYWLKNWLLSFKNKNWLRDARIEHSLSLLSKP
ncbi:MAG: hypothetical protein KGH74_03785, partial [Candidatus Micrarchaeota archaeon]|nr:hypothetical protein [Candidatus Micrarchaeota archaeon]